ncbi:hypothetical protein HYV57_02340 [Candidatus Peregrinibacteria bacterium]|nr:hypothetical protein [Candidatus Peregrinibacteria bacterium]
MEEIDEEGKLMGFLDEIDMIIATDFLTNQITALRGFIEMFGESLKNPQSTDWSNIELLSFFREKHSNILNELQERCEPARQANPKTDLDERALATLLKIEGIDAEIQKCNESIGRRSLNDLNTSIQKLHLHTLKGSGRVSGGWK